MLVSSRDICRGFTFAMTSIDYIQQLRKETGAGVMDVKKALQEAGGDVTRAKEILRVKGAAAAAKKSERQTHEGLVVSYIHPGSKIGVLLKLYCETDFVARTEEFQTLARDIAMHIAAMNPEYVHKDDIPEAVIEAEKKIYREQYVNSRKSPDVFEKIIEGKLEKFAEEAALLSQPFVKDQDKTIREVIDQTIAKLGENIQIGDFVRYEL